MEARPIFFFQAELLIEIEPPLEGGVIPFDVPGRGGIAVGEGEVEMLQHNPVGQFHQVFVECSYHVAVHESDDVAAEGQGHLCADGPGNVDTQALVEIDDLEFREAEIEDFAHCRVFGTVGDYDDVIYRQSTQVLQNGCDTACFVACGDNHADQAPSPRWD